MNILRTMLLLYIRLTFSKIKSRVHHIMGWNCSCDTVTDIRLILGIFPLVCSFTTISSLTFFPHNLVDQRNSGTAASFSSSFWFPSASVSLTFSPLNRKSTSDSRNSQTVTFSKRHGRGKGRAERLQWVQFQQQGTSPAFQTGCRVTRTAKSQPGHQRDCV